MSDRQAALNAALDLLNKNFGAGTALRLGDDDLPRAETISTGSIALDHAMGGGFARGRITELYGPEGSCKTTAALHGIANCQRNGGEAALIDTENALSPEYARSIGVDVDRLIVSQPETAEQAFEIMDALVNSGGIDMVVLDSVAALLPRAERDGNYGDAVVGLSARILSQAMRKLSGPIRKQNVATVFINQLREKVGVVYGSPEVTSGGRALKYYSSCRVDLRRAELVKEGTETVGTAIKAKVVKCKIAPPFRTAVFNVVFGEGISKEAELINLGADLKVLTKKGSWYSYGDVQVGQGLNKSIEWLKGNPKFAAEIEESIRGMM